MSQQQNESNANEVTDNTATDDVKGTPLVDLTPSEEEQADVKGGPIYMKYDDIKGDVTSHR